MARFAEPYALYSRKMRDGRKVWYYRVHLEGGGRSGGISTGKLSKADAYGYCEARRKEGTLLPEREAKPPKPAEEVRRSRRAPTLQEWADERRWWQWDDNGPACEYCKLQLKLSEAGAPAVQRPHADKSLRVLNTHILPAHGAYRIDQITPDMIEDLRTSWGESDGVSHKTINNWASVYRVMMAEAKRLKKLPENPWDVVADYKTSKPRKGILSLAEYKALMSPKAMLSKWSRTVYYDLNLLASVTGLRLGECLDLHPESIHTDHITVGGSWDIKYGEGPQKTKRGTDEIPVPHYVADRLLALVEITPPGGYIFSLSDGKRPCTGNRVNDALADALAKIKISNEERMARKISFHSWRAFANTYFRAAGISDAKVREITRHESAEMTEHYTPWRVEDFAEIATAQGELVKLLGAE